MFAARRLAAVIGVVVLGACGGGDSEPSPSPSIAPTTDPAVTAPPALTPEEQAAADIQATFEELITARDAYYANASDFSLEEVATTSPATEWNVTGQAELEMSNWTVLWHQGGLEQVGSTTVADHDISSIEMAEAEDQADQAASVACLDMRSLKFADSDGSPADLSYAPDEYQAWEMTWIYFPAPAPDAGVNEAGWHVRTIDVSRNVPC